ncbi:Uncharacterised protein [Mycobacterium tuberculosis]|nr:Uncharacterised protein [Mycobacterium tuberculosis]
MPVDAATSTSIVIMSKPSSLDSSASCSATRTQIAHPARVKSSTWGLLMGASR